MKCWRRPGIQHHSAVFRRYASVDYLLRTLPQKKLPNNGQNIPKASSNLALNLPPQDLTRLLITPKQLTISFWPSAYVPPSRVDLAASQAVFSRAQFKLEWTLAHYDDIPDVKYQRLKAELETQLAPTAPIESQKRKSFGIEPHLLHPLPEILFLGHTNVGKSSLVNNLFGAGSGTLAYVSRQPGYTQTMNCYNVGKKFRLIDSPGYGERGDEKQGHMVLEYLERRKVLRQVYVLIDAAQGMLAEDEQMLEHLIDSGIPFDIVLTKVDQVIDRYVGQLPSKVKDAMKKEKVLAPKTRLEYANQIKATNQKIENYFTGLIEGVGLNELATLPRIFFNNAYRSTYVKQCYGYRELRHAMALV